MNMYSVSLVYSKRLPDSLLDTQLRMAIVSVTSEPEALGMFIEKTSEELKNYGLICKCVLKIEA